MAEPKIIRELRENKNKIGVLSENLEEVNRKVNAHKADYTQHVKWLGTVGGSGATMTATLDSLTSYVNGLGVSITTNANRTGNLTLNINGLGAIPIKKSSGDNADEMIANSVYTLRYYNGNFILQGEGSDFSDTDKSNLINSINTIYDM